MRRIRLYGEVLRDFVERWGLLARGVDIRVPRRLWTASHDEIGAYLRSVFQADGYVSARRDNGCENARVGFAVIGERWTEDVQLLLDVLGIYSRRIRKTEPRDDRHDLHEVTIAIGSERARFAELVGFLRRQKQTSCCSRSTLRNPKRCPDLREEEIVAIETPGAMEVYDIQTESGEFLTNNVAVHNCFILSVEDTMESILDWNTKEGMIFRGGSGSGINLSKIRGSMEPLAKGGTASGPVSLHARRRLVGGHDQVGRQDAPRGEDGRARRRPPGHPRVHLVQGQGGGQGRGAARRRLRHVDRRRRLQLDPVPEREQLGARDRRVHARRSSTTRTGT